MASRIVTLALFALATGAAPPARPEIAADQQRADILRAFTGLAADAETTRAQAALTAGNLHSSLFVQPLIARLASAEASVRAAAATALGELGVPSTSKDLFDLIGALMRAAEEADENVAKAAIDALGRYPFPEVRMRLEKVATDPSFGSSRRAAAFEALKTARVEAKARMVEWLELAAREAGGERASDVEGDLLLRSARDLLSRDRALHVSAAKSIASWPDVQEKLPFLRRALTDRNPDVRRVSARAIAGVPSELGAPLLAEAAGDADVEVRRAVIDGLAKQRDPAFVPVLARRLEQESDPSVRAALGSAISAQEEAPVLAALSAFDGRVRDAVRGDAIELVGSRTATRAAELLVRYLLDAQQEATAKRASALLAKRSDAQAVPSLLAAMERTEPGLAPRARVIAALADRTDAAIAARALALIEAGRGDRGVVDLVRGRAEARAGLLGMTAHAQPAVRSLALDGVEDMHGPDVLAALVAAVEANANDDRVFEMLLRQREQALLTPVLALLGSSRHAHRYGALFRALEGARDPRIAEPVVAAAVADPGLAVAAIGLLKAQAPRRAAPALARIAGNRRFNDAVRARATAALAELPWGSAPNPATKTPPATSATATATIALAEPGSNATLANNSTQILAIEINTLNDEPGTNAVKTNDPTRDINEPGAAQPSSTRALNDEPGANAVKTNDPTRTLTGEPGTDAVKTNDPTRVLAGADITLASAPSRSLSDHPGIEDAPADDDTPMSAAELEALIKPLAKDEAVAVRSAARNALHRLDPDRYPRWDPYGRIPLVVEAGLFGAGMMLVATDLADAELSPAFTGAVGLVLGGATPFLLTLNEDVTLGDAGYFGTVGLYGTLGGWGLAGAAGASQQNRRWATLGGEIVGVSVAGLTMKYAEWSLDEVALANVSAFQAGIATAAFTSLYLDHRNRDRRIVPYAGMAASALATVPVALFARRLEVDDHLLTMATLMTHGAFLGMFAPGILDSEGYNSERAATAMVVGQGAGYFAGLVLAQLGDTSLRGAAFSGLGAVAGAALFGGAGVAFEPTRGRGAFALAQGGAAAGALALYLLEDHIELRDNDAELLTYATIGGAVAGGQFSVRLEEKTFGEAAFPGGVLMGAGAGFAGGLLLSQLVDLSDKTLYGTLGGGGAFAIAGSGLGYLIPELGVRTRSTLTGAFIAGGLALTAPFAESLTLSDADLGYVVIAAATGGLLTATVPAYWHGSEGDDLEASEVGGGVVFGASIGAIGAIAVAQALDFELRDVGVVSMGTIAGGSLGLGLGGLIPAVKSDAQLALFQAGAMAGLLSMTYLVGGPGSPSETKRDRLFEYSSMFAAHGALHGGLIPTTWRTGEVPGKETMSGVLFGAGLGAAAGALYLRFDDAPPDTPDLFEASLYSAIADTFGFSVGFYASEPQLGAILVQSMGLGAYAAGLALAPYTDYEAIDATTFLFTTTAFGVIGGVLPAALKKDPTDRELRGAATAAASLGLLGTALYVQLVDEREDLEMAILFSSAAAGAGGLSLLLPELDTQSAAWIFSGAGALALAGGIAFSPYTSYSSGDNAMIATLGVFGGWHGAWVPALRRERGALDRKEIGGGAMAGAGLGLLGGMILSQLIEPDAGDVGEAFLLSAAFAGTGAGLELALPNSSRRAGAIALEVSGALGLGLSAIAAPYTTYSDEDLTLMLISQLAGAYHGALLPRAWSEAPTDVMRGGGAMLGAGAGAIAGAVLSQTGDFAYDTQLESVVFMAAGDAIGGGLALFREDDPGRTGISLFAAGGLGMFGAGLAIAPYTEFDDGDKVFTGMGAALGAWHGAFLPLVFGPRSSRDHRQELGGAMLGAGAGALITGGIAQFVSLDTGDQVEGALSWTLASMIGGGAGLMSRSLDTRGKALLVEGSGIVGLATGLFLSEALELESGGDMALIPFALAYGGALGATLPVLSNREELREQELGGGALLGAGAFAVGALTLAQLTDFETSDVAELAAWSAVGGAIGAGLGWTIPDSSRTARYALTDGASLLAFAGALAFAPMTELDDGDFTTLGLGAAIGAAMGGAAPALWNNKLSEVPPKQIGGGMLLGTSLGLGAGLLFSQVANVEGVDRKYAALGAGMGAMSGSGIGLLASKDDRLAVGLAEALTFAGAMGVAASAGAVEYDAGDLAFGSAYVAYLTWHTLGLTLLLDGSDRQAAGAALATVGLGTVTGMYLSPYINLDLPKVLMLFAGNVWGTWIGGWGGAILRKQLDEVHGKKSAGLTLISTVLGSDLGLAITGLVVGGLLDVEPTRFAVINLSGLGGMMIGMLAAGFAKSEPLKEGNVIGSLSGLVLGAVVTSFIDFKSTPTWDELLASEETKAKEDKSAQVVAKSPGSAKLLEIESWFPSAQVEPTDTGDERYMFSIAGTWQ